MSLNVAKQLTCLHHYHIEDVFSEFAICAMRTDYSIERISRRASTAYSRHRGLNQGEQALSLRLVDGLFDLFDTDGNGVVDFSELASGLSVLCGGSRDAKQSGIFIV